MGNTDSVPGGTGLPPSMPNGSFVFNPRSPEIDAAEAAGIRQLTTHKKYWYKAIHIGGGLILGLIIGFIAGWLLHTH